jgi:ankyrin repeat protein
MTLPLTIQAIRRNDVQLLVKQIDKGANLEATGGTGKSPLHWAIWERRKDMVELLINNGANVFATTSAGCNALEFAALSGELDSVKVILGSGKVDTRPEYGYLAMCYAAEQGYLEIVKTLVSHGFPIAYPLNDFQGRTPLNWAIQGHHCDIVSWLLENGALVNQFDEQGFTPLMQACGEGIERIVDILLQHRADIKLTNPNSGSSALHYAASWGYRKIANKLIGCGADVALKNHAGLSPINLDPWLSKDKMKER